MRAADAPDPEAAVRELETKGILVVPQAWYERPLYYHPNRLNVIGPDVDVHWPAYSKLMDFELEFGCYIGKPGKDIPKDKAREHIFGYTIFNDFSARDEQTKDMPGQLGPGKGKDFDGSNAMGPCVVTADEIDPYRLTMVARVNGDEWGRGSSRVCRQLEDSQISKSVIHGEPSCGRIQWNAMHCETTNSPGLSIYYRAAPARSAATANSAIVSLLMR